MRKIVFIGIATFAVAALAGCSNSAAGKDAADTNTQLEKYQQAGQTVPTFDRSDIRQTLIDIEKAQADGTPSTAFFFEQGAGFSKPILSCSAKGYAVASTTQLTSPDQRVDGSVVVALMEPTGVYTGPSAGTYVRCVSTDGKVKVVYWEGNVMVVPGTATWSDELRQVVMK